MTVTDEHGPAQTNTDPRDSRRVAAVLLVVLASSGGWAEEPQVELRQVGGEVYAGQAHEVEVQVSWAGAADAFVVLPVKVEPLDWGSAAVSKSEVSVEGDRNVSTQVLTVVARETGRYELPALEVPVLAGPLPKDVALETLAPSVTLRTEALAMEVAEGAAGHLKYWLALAVAVVAAVSGLIAVVFKGRRKTTAPGASPEDLMRAALHQARRHQLDGKYYEFYQELAGAVAAGKGKNGQSLMHRLELRVQEVGFKGIQPTHEEMSGDLKEVERELGIRN